MALLVLKGTGAAPGIGEGQAYMVAPAPNPGDGVKAVISLAARDTELARLRLALAEAAAQLQQLTVAVTGRTGATDAAIFEAQELFLRDPSLVGPMETAVRDRGLPASLAVWEVLEDAARDLESLP